MDKTDALGFFPLDLIPLGDFQPYIILNREEISVPK